MAKLTKEQITFLKANNANSVDALTPEQRREYAKLGTDTMGSTSTNVGKAQTAVQPSMNSTRDVSMVSEDSKVKPVIEANKKVENLKMQANPDKTEVVQAEQNVTDTTEAANQSIQENPTTDTSTILDNPDVANSDEGQVAKAAVDSGDASMLGSITDPDGEPVLSGHYDESGRWVPYVKADVEDPRVFSRGWAMALTIISAALFGLSGGIIPPINFMQLDGQDEYIANLNKVNQDYADLVNGTSKERNANTTKVEGTETALKSGKENPDLYSRENTDAVARANAATQGNVALEQTEMNADLAKTLKDMDIGLNLSVLKLNQEQQVKMAELLYDQEVSKVVNQIKTMKANGMSTDEIAKYISSMQGTTTLARGLGYGEQAANIAGTIVDAVVPGPSSDERVKSYKTSNTNLLRKNKLWR